MLRANQANKVRVFWRSSALLSVTVFLCFFLALYTGFKNNDSQLRSLAQYLGYFSLIQLIASVVFSIATFKKQTIWTLTYLFLMATFSLLELILFFGSLTGTLGG
jgi:predicted membrane channel-forming protein YqfA (hemolysin III family)